MPYKDIDKQRAAVRDHYRRNKAYYLAKNIRNRNINKDLLDKFKDKPCMDCGVKYPPYVMDFDHKKDKLFNISGKVLGGMSFKKLLLEIEKCDLVCANCHRIRTYNRTYASEAQLDEQLGSNEEGESPNLS